MNKMYGNSTSNQSKDNALYDCINIASGTESIGSLCLKIH